VVFTTPRASELRTFTLICTVSKSLTFVTSCWSWYVQWDSVSHHSNIDRTWQFFLIGYDNCSGGSDSELTVNHFRYPTCPDRIRLFLNVVNIVQSVGTLVITPFAHALLSFLCFCGRDMLQGIVRPLLLCQQYFSQTAVAVSDCLACTQSGCCHF